MWRWKSIVAIVVTLCLDAGAQEADSFAVISEFMGNLSAEEADPSEIERLENFIRHPLRINYANVSRIRESGLFTPFQMASLLDYRTRHGDILSLTELSSMDGFGEEFVRCLAPFISLETDRNPGQRASDSRRLYHELQIKGGVRINDGNDEQYALKYRIEAGNCIRASFALSKSLASKSPDAVTGSLFWNSRRQSVKVAVGNFNARFGQGLALWNGMSISGLNKPSSYLKRSSNLSPSSSYTGNYAFTGVATEMMTGNLRATLMAALSGSKPDIGVLPAVNLSWLWPSGQIGLTHYADLRFPLAGMRIPDMKTSVDIALTARGVDFFAEAVYDWFSCVPAFLAGLVFPAGENLRMASMLRYYPAAFSPAYSAAARSLTRCSNEYAASLSGEFSAGQWIRIKAQEGFGSSARRMRGMLCIDGAYLPVAKSDSGKSLQFRSIAEIKLMLNESVALKWRVDERIRTWGQPFRTDFRMDIFCYSRFIDLNIRTNLVNCVSTSFLFYAEGTLKPKSVRISLRSGVFHVDNWDDRIYAYERDIPGSFNVPSFYGRGYWISLSGNWKFARWGSAYIRGAMTRYPWMEKKKPGKAELKLMLEIRI